MENHLGQPVGTPIDWRGAACPARVSLAGRYCRLEPLGADHAPALFAAFQADRQGRNWTYMVNGPYAGLSDFTEWISQASEGQDPLFYAICDTNGAPLGYAGFMRIDAAMGVMEVGSINFSPALQGTRSASEAMFLMMRHAFRLGYRRFEWKCDSLNAPSIRAAKRLGFTFEGVFRQAVVYKGRNRDTAWFSVLDSEWPALERAFTAWLAEKNFDSDGQQAKSLSEFIAKERT